MLRRLCLLGIGLVVLAGGCEKKESQPPAPQGQETTVAAPAGFAHAPGTEPPVFISKKPVSMEAYSAYLRATGQGWPESLSWEDAAPSGAVTGLSLAEAERFATWHISRLPTGGEWKQAAEIVGGGPYPWGRELGGDEPRPGARLLLVRDWTEGSPRHQEALKAQETLAEELLAQCRLRVWGASKALDDMVTEGSVRLTEKWKQAKPLLFGVSRQQKQRAELTATRDRKQDTLAFLQEVGREKLRPINLKFGNEATPEELAKAVGDYRAFLAAQRKKVQEKQEEFVQAGQAASRKVTELTRKLEAAGDGLGANLADVAAATRKAVTLDVDTIEEGVIARQVLGQARLQVKAAEQVLAGFLDRLVADLKARAGESEAEIAKLAVESEIDRQIEQLQAKIKGLSENLEEQFLQEPHLFNALKELTEISARMTGTESEARALEEVLDAFRQIETEDVEATGSGLEAEPDTDD